MPRPRSYDRQEAVEKACKAFWEHGFQALGVREIERLTGLNQFAIRTEFGGKEGLYLEALKFYGDAAISTALAPLRDGGIAEIVAFLRGLVDSGSMSSSPWGCLIVNTGIENARVRSERLQAATESYWNTLEGCIYGALENAIARGEIASDLDKLALARGMVTAVMGVHSRNRTSRSNQGGRELVDLVCSHLYALSTP